MALQDLLAEDEEVLGKWTINYIPSTEERYLGKLVVTDRRLLFDAQFDVSFEGMIRETLFLVSGSEGYVQIERDQIKQVHDKSSFFNKRAIVTLQDGDQHIFDYGMLSVAKLVKAMHSMLN